MTSNERTIIIGVDYSDFCIPAVDEALRLAAASPSTRLVPLLALNGGLPSSPDKAVEMTAEDMTKEVVERAKENLIRLVEARAKALGLPLPRIDAAVRFGLPAERLLRAAREEKAVLIAIGTHGRRGLEHLFLGSVAEEVMRQAPCSVLVARSPQLEAAKASSDKSAETDSRVSEWESNDDEEAPAPDGEPQMLTEPHLDAGRVVLHVLDVASGQVFLCAFEDPETVRVDPLEGDWVPAPSSAARARVAQAARALAARDRASFGELFEELARRRELEARTRP